MKRISLIAIVLFSTINLSAQINVAGKKIPENIQYLNIKYVPNNTIKVNYGQGVLDNKSVLTDEAKKALKIASPIKLLSYLYNKGWEPAVVSKELNDFAIGIRKTQSWLLFKRKK